MDYRTDSPTSPAFQSNLRAKYLETSKMRGIMTGFVPFLILFKAQLDIAAKVNGHESGEWQSDFHIRAASD